MRIAAILKKLTLILFAAIIIFLCNQPILQARIYAPPDRVIDQYLFGMHIHRATTLTPWPSVPFKAWRLWDAYVAWPNLEPRKGEWKFDNLDKIVKLASSNGVEILLPLGLTPAWAASRPSEKSAYSIGNASEPKNLDDWRDYVSTVATRYKGKIHYYEIWNEPNLRDFYTGTPAYLLKLSQIAYQTLKNVDPTVMVVSPSATGGINGLKWLDSYLSMGGAGSADIIGFHFYVKPGQPELIVPLAKHINEIKTKYGIDKPVWNTEFGWDNQKKFSVSEAASYVARSYILNWSSGIERLYWYSWDNTYWTSLRMVSEQYTLTAAAIAYTEIQKWLVGARMTSLETTESGFYFVKIVRDGGYKGWIVWNTNGRKPLPLPESWGVSRCRNLSGESLKVKKKYIPEIGYEPILFESYADH